MAIVRSVEPVLMFNEAGSWHCFPCIVMTHRREKIPNLETMLTARQVADFLHVSISTVRRWSDRGMLTCYRIGSRGDRRYRREDILLFLGEGDHRSG